MGVLWSVEIIASGYWWTGWGRKGYSDWLLVDGLGSVVVIATGYWWKNCGA